jgi:copper chaperone
MKTHELKINGMTCGHCVMHVKNELSKISGLVIEDVQIGSARVQYDESAVAQKDIAAAIEEAGYTLLSSN